METIGTTLFLWIDCVLIAGYRITGFAFVDFLIGTLWLAFWCVIVGELTVGLALKINRRYFYQMNDDMRQKEQLALRAYKAGDMVAYEALNKQATDAWGKRFFTMFGYSAGIFWPLPFALGWMQTRFAGIEFVVAPPLSWIFGATAGYPFVFIPIYILARILFKYVRPWLPFFRGIQRILDEGHSRPQPAASLPNG
jgi:hypothetical protein